MNLKKVNYLSINQQAYDVLADEFNDKIKVRKERQKIIVQKFIKFIKANTSGKEILELGPAAGYTTNLLTNYGFKVDALEFSKKLVNYCKLNAPKAVVINDEFLSHDFKDKKYDAIMAIAFIHLFPKSDCKKVFLKINSLLKNKGICYISTTVNSRSLEGFEEKFNFSNNINRFRRKFTINELIKSVEENLFKIVDSEIVLDQEVEGKKWIDLILTK